MVGLDRKEKGLSDQSSSKELEKDFNLQVESIVNLDSLIGFVENESNFKEHLNSLHEYRESWGA